MIDNMQDGVLQKILGNSCRPLDGFFKWIL